MDAISESVLDGTGRQTADELLFVKPAKIIPIYENGDRHLFNNYRPISLLPQFAKIIEKLFVHRLDKFVENHKLLSDNQFGFRNNRFNSIAAMKLKIFLLQ